MALPFIDGLNRVLRGVVPTDNAGGLLAPDEAQNAQRQGLLGFGSGLLGAAGPNRLPVSFGQALSAAALQSNQMQNSAIDDQMKRKLLAGELYQRMMPRGSNQQLIGSASPADFTPESLAIYKQTQNPADLKPVGRQLFGKVNTQYYTPASLSKFALSQDPADLVPRANLQAKDLPGGGIGMVDPISGELKTTPVTNDEAQSQAAALAKAKSEAEARARTLGEKQAGAEFDLPRIKNNAEQALATIEQLKNHPGLPYITGWYSKSPVVPETQQAAADALAQQVEGKTFLEAFNSLKGGGQITEIEGKKATSAIARLYRAQKTDDYRSALNDLESVIRAGLSRAETQAGQEPAAAKPSLPDFSKMTDDELRRLAGGK